MNSESCEKIEICNKRNEVLDDLRKDTFKFLDGKLPKEATINELDETAEKVMTAILDIWNKFI